MSRNKKLKTIPQRYKPGWLRQMDRRSAFGGRLLRLFKRIVEDLGGEDALSTIQLTLVERFVFLNARLQQLETQLSMMDPDEIDAKLEARWAQANNALTGLARTLGLKRNKKSSNQDLETYLKLKKRA